MTVVDLAGAALIAGSLTFLVVILTAAVVSAHTSAELPAIVRYGSIPREVGRRALLVEIPIGIVLLGGGELVMALMLVHPASTIPVRILAAAQLVVAAAWILYLGRLVRRRKQDTV